MDAAVSWDQAAASLPVGVAVLDAEGTVVRCNPAWEAVAAAAGPSLLDRLGDVARSVRSEGPGRRVEAVPVPPGQDGRRLLLHVESVGDGPGGCMVACVHDATRLDRTQQQLEESRGRMDTLLETLPGMAFRCRNDRDRTLDSASGGCLALTGYAPEDLQGNRVVAFGALIQPEDRARVRRRVQEAVAEGRPYHVVYRIRGRDGEPRWVREQGQAVACDAGGPVMLEGFVMDVTEQRSAHEDPRMHEEPGTQWERPDPGEGILTEFIQIMAHELSHPVLPVMLELEGLKRHPEPLHPEVQDALERVERQMLRMRDLLEEFRYAALLGRQRLQLRVEEVDAALLAEAAVAEHRAEAQARGLGLEVEAREARVWADARRLEQVLANLVSNALKFTPTGGRVQVAAGPLEDSGAFLEVADTGPGVPPDLRTNVFEPFQRLRGGGAPGTGLGLYIAQGLVEAHGGRITCMDGPGGRGAVFRVVLPGRPPDAGGP